jgi:phospholipase D1/2
MWLGFTSEKLEWKKRWAVLTADGVSLFLTPTCLEPSEVLLFDTSFNTFNSAYGGRSDDSGGSMVIHGATWVLTMSIPNVEEARSWQAAVSEVTYNNDWIIEHRYGSFAAPRENLRKTLSASSSSSSLISSPGSLPEDDFSQTVKAQWFVDGEAYFATAARALQAAKYTIFITDWWITFDIELERSKNPQKKLCDILKKKAEEGVQIYILLYQEMNAVMPNGSEFAEQQFLALHPENIHVMRHRSRFSSNLLWSHHEKLCVIDHCVSFIGGLDLAINRWDNAKHELFDVEGKVWRGKDYCNVRVKDVHTTHKRDIDLSDRTVVPPMPWHDIHCGLYGGIARDIARHFIGRWNHCRDLRSDCGSIPALQMLSQDKLFHEGIRNLMKCSLPASDYPHTHSSWPKQWLNTAVPIKGQIVRSVSRWSAGTHLEASIHSAWCSLIENADTFIYIENQFFVSGIEGDRLIGNRVLDAIFNRIKVVH